MLHTEPNPAEQTRTVYPRAQLSRRDVRQRKDSSPRASEGEGELTGLAAVVLTCFRRALREEASLRVSRTRVQRTPPAERVSYT